MRRVALLLGLLLTACAATGAWTKEGATEAEIRRDLTVCQNLAEDLTARDRQIDQDIRAARADGRLAADTRSFRHELRDVSFERRFGDIVDRCMRGRGYARPSEVT